MAVVESPEPSQDQGEKTPSLESQFVQLQKEHKELQEIIKKKPIREGAGENILMVKHEPLYVALEDIQPILRFSRITVLILSIGGSFLTAYVSQGDLQKILYGVLLVSTAILMDHIWVNRKVKTLKSRKEKVLLASSPR